MLCEEIEEWRMIAEAPNYEVSNLGRIKRAFSGQGTQAGRILRVFRHSRKSEHLSVQLHLGPGRAKTFKVHRLVCIAFHGASPSLKHEVAHWDGDAKNNVPHNLRWATHKENGEDVSRHGIRKGIKAQRAKLDDDKVRLLRQAKGCCHQGVIALGKQFGVSKNAAVEAAAGRSWTHVQ